MAHCSRLRARYSRDFVCCLVARFSCGLLWFSFSLCCCFGCLGCFVASRPFWCASFSRLRSRCRYSCARFLLWFSSSCLVWSFLVCCWCLGFCWLLVARCPRSRAFSVVPLLVFLFGALCPFYLFCDRALNCIGL